MTVLIRFRERTGHVWLEVDYDGLEPPVALFDDLRMIGWSPPVPAPPPASALDWDHPDPAQGTKYSVRPFRVSEARVDGPRGTGRSGTWTSGERPAYLRTLEGVLRRHAADVIAHLPSDSEALPHEPAVAPPPVVGASATSGSQRVWTVLDRAIASVVVEQLRADGHQPAYTATTRIKMVSFRGNQQESEVPAMRVEVVAAGQAVDEVRTTLAFDGDLERVVVEPIESAVAAEPVGSTPPVFAPPLIEEGVARASVAMVSALVPLAAAPGARGRLEAKGLEVRVEAAVLRIQGSYRGNSYLDDVPGQRLTVDTDARHLEAVISVVVEATGIKREDSERLVVHRPTAPGTDAGGTRLGGPTLRLVS